MIEEYKTLYSKILERDTEYAVYGTGGKTCFVFPEQDGRYYDFKNFGLLEQISPWIEKEKVKVICLDSIDKETWSAYNENPRKRLELQEKWFKYFIEEITPLYLNHGEQGMVTGCSMGGLHSANAFFRRPDLFDIFLALSGIYHGNYFIPNYYDDLMELNSPVDYLKSISDNHPNIDLYRQKIIVACIGQDKSEYDLLCSTRELDTVLAQKNIPHWFDYWGFDVTHDWVWWRKQIPYFFEHIFGKV